MSGKDALRWAAWAAVLAMAGCNRNPYVASQSPQVWQGQHQQHMAQLQDLDRRAAALDVDNRDLHTELAKSQQQVRLLQDEVALLRKQLADKVSELREVLVAKQEVERRAETVEASTRLRGSATITANNSLAQQLPQIDIPGVEVRRDGDLLRIELPADRLFHQGTVQMLPASTQLLDQVAAAISRSYAKQMIGIEGHTDSMPNDTMGNQQLASAQAVAVYEALTRRNLLPAQQLFTVGFGANRPLVSNATPAGRARNRRVEVVIYPETLP